MSQNQDVFSHVAGHYDAYRPTPPAALPDLLTQLAQVDLPARVVDLGSGTGLSTLIWAGKAQSVLGIEPNEDMLRVARERAASQDAPSTVTFQDGTGAQTGLPDACADIVTCAQSFHWMEPVSTLAEIARILRPGGVFAAYDYTWPPTLGWQAESAYETFMDRAWGLKAQRGQEDDMHIWTLNRQLAVIQESGHFGYVKEFWLHQQESGNAERFTGLALTNGVIQFLRQGLMTEEEIGLAEFKEAVQKSIGSEPIPWYFSYHVRIGIKEG